MKKSLMLLCVAVLIGGTLALSPGEIGAITFDFTNLGLSPQNSPVTFSNSGITLLAYGVSNGAGAQISELVGDGLGVVGGSDYWISNFNRFAAGGGTVSYYEFLIFQKPADVLFDSIKISELVGTALDPALVRIAAGTSPTAGGLLGTSIRDFSGTSDFTIPIPLELQDAAYLFVIAPQWAVYPNELTGDPGTLAPKTIFRVAEVNVTPAPVPEPATMFLLGSGLIGVGAFVRRRFKK